MSDYYPDSDRDTITDQLDVVIRLMDGCQAVATAAQHPVLLPATHGYSLGRKYARVWSQQWNQNPYGPNPDEVIKGQRFVCFFVQLDNGDVWKPGGWKKPVLNFTRGNITTPEGRAAITFGKMAPSGYWYHGF